MRFGAKVSQTPLIFFKGVLEGEWTQVNRKPEKKKKIYVGEKTRQVDHLEGKIELLMLLWVNKGHLGPRR